MEQYIIFILVFILAFLASFVGSMVGSGGLLVIPFLIFFGLPPQVAIATNKLGSLGLSIGAFLKYSKEKKIDWRYVLLFSLIGLISAYAGANFLLRIDKELLTRSIGFIILLLLPIIFIKKKTGVKKTKVSTSRKTIGYVLYFLAMIWGAFFGGGGGTLVIYILMIFFGFKIIEASATNMIPWFLMSLFSVIIFAINGIVNFVYGTILIVGMLTGGYFGAHTAVRKGDRWVKVLFAAIVVASAVKLIFF